MKSLQDKIEAASYAYDDYSMDDSVGIAFKAGAQFALSELMPMLRECRATIIFYDDDHLTETVKKLDAIIGDNNVKTEAVIRAESVKVYDRMNPTLDVLLVSLQMYADVDHTIDAYPLSRAEAQLIVDKLSCHIGQTNYSVTPNSSFMDKVKQCHICHCPGDNHFDSCKLITNRGDAE